MRLKLFVGIELPQRVRAACAGAALRLEKAGLVARFEAPEKLHITLAFLGWLDPGRIATIGASLEGAARSFAPFALTLDKVGAFPHERRPRVVWIGERNQSEAFRSFANAVRAACSELGFEFDKAPVAHVTVARVKGGQAHLPMLEIRPVKFTVDALTLFESIPAGRTTRYEVRARYPLKSQ